MIGVIFSVEPPNKSIWGDVIGWTNILDKWEVDFYIMVDKDALVPNWEDSRRESYRVNNYDEALAKLKEVHPECITTLFTNNTDKTLNEHTHYKEECYILGPDNSWIDLDVTTKVKIPSGPIWAVNCVNIALYDRKVRNGSSNN